jgi:Tfp pilus assembly protein PilF
MQTKPSRIWSKLQGPVRFTALLALASILAGCVTGSKPAVVAKPLTDGPAVSRLEDGREGFMITENPVMDAEARRDFERAVALMESKDYDGAVTLLEKVIEKSPGATAPYINAAIAYRQTGKMEKAEEHLKTALSIVPEHPVASNEYGLLLRKTGRFAEARVIYEKSLASFPDFHPAHRNLGILCDLYLNDLACALEHYQIYSEAMPTDEQVKLWVADLRLRTGN